MTTQATPVAVARAFTVAWSSHDMDGAANFLAQDVVFDGPGGHTTGREAYMSGLIPFATRVTSANILAAFGDDERAIIMYEVTVGPGTILTCAELLTVHDGQIQADRLAFDTAAIRPAQPPTA